MNRAKTPNISQLLLVLPLALTAGCAATPPAAEPPELVAFHEFEQASASRRPRRSAALAADAKKQARQETGTLRSGKKTSRRPAQNDVPPHQTALQEHQGHRQQSMLTPRPFLPGETAVYTVKYIDVAAGEMTLAMPARPNPDLCQFQATLSTNKVFSLFFRYRNSVAMNYDCSRMVPLVISSRTEENNKVSETRLLFDWTEMQAFEWEHSIDDGDPVQQRTKRWPLVSDAQSLFSVLYYLRAQKLEPGTIVRFPLSHDEKNVEFRAEVLRREQIRSALGVVPALVLHASREVTAAFSKGADGETVLWLSDDSRHVILRFEAPLKHGRISTVLKSYTAGQGP